MSKKYIVYGQKFRDDDDDDLGIRFRTEKIKTCNSKEEANRVLANVTHSANYEYEWIEEVEE